MTFTNVGKNINRNWLASGSGYAPTNIGVGSISTSATTYDTGLGCLIVMGSISGHDTTTNRLVEFDYNMATTTPGFSFYAKEVGLFNGSPTGSLFSRSTFASIEKLPKTELEFIIGVRFE